MSDPLPLWRRSAGVAWGAFAGIIGDIVRAFRDGYHGGMFDTFLDVCGGILVGAILGFIVVVVRNIATD